MATTRTILRLGALAACSFLMVAAAPDVQARELRFEERVAAQEAIERVYWSHRIWPEVNPQPKPPFEAVLSETAIRGKVARALRLSASLDAATRKPLTGDDLQGEIARMASHTRAPGILRELFEALGDEPLLIAECLARPALVGRLAAEAGLREDDAAPGIPPVVTIQPPAAGYAIPAIPGGGCANDGWAPSSLATGTGVRLPTARQLHTAVWTGAEMIVWGGWDGASTAYNDGGRYDPAIDSWLASILSNAAGSNVPSARLRHTAIWTGTEMIIWGGRNAAGTALNTGGRFDPTADTWSPSSLVNASGTNVPAARQLHTAVWTGGRMIVWGGSPDAAANALNTGGAFDPGTDGWTVSILNNGSGSFVPDARIDHTAVSAGAEMIVWGGRGTGGADLDDGGIYNPTTDAWISTVLNTGGGTRVPSARHFHTAVWTGTEMIIWGGASGAAAASVNTGGRFSRAADGWLATSLTNGSGTRVPSARQNHTAIWTGGEMIVWGGSTDGASATLNTGGRYGPVDDAWAVTSLTNATGVRVPSARQYHTAVWTSLEEMIVFGGSSGTPTGGLFCATCPFSSWHGDADGDGYGDPVVVTAACTAPPGFVAPSGDCDDTDPAIHPGAVELCDGVDNDCDTIDDNGGDILCDDAAACTADVCNGAGGCAAPPSNVDLDTTGFSAGRVDGRDLVVLADAWNSCPGDLRYDPAANLDQATTPPNDCINDVDFHLFMNSFGQSCP